MFAAPPPVPAGLQPAVVKAIVVGDGGVGKSCLQLRFTQASFRHTHEVTIGVEFGARSVVIDGRPVKMYIWDTAGQENFRAITRSYYRGSAVCLLVFDLTNSSSFASIRRWHRDVVENAAPQVVIALVGNKNDLAPSRRVSREQAEALASEIGALYFETSARRGENVAAPFEAAAAEALRRLAGAESSSGCYLVASEPIGARAQGCCHS